MVLAEIGTHGVLDARLGGYRYGERSLAHQPAGSTGSGDLVIADRGLWSVEFAHAFTVIELAFEEIKKHLGPGGPIRSRTPEGVRQELWGPPYPWTRTASPISSVSASSAEAFHPEPSREPLEPGRRDQFGKEG
ncbi:hypothetical protein [Streptomyces sp. NPDC057617]|uniref:hypothetical protein n=1 Tax=Streptomyces sp. NPDC057617 TaxID=3346184 RepID=UPI0036A61E94